MNVCNAPCAGIAGRNLSATESEVLVPKVRAIGFASFEWITIAAAPEGRNIIAQYEVSEASGVLGKLLNDFRVPLAGRHSPART